MASLKLKIMVSDSLILETFIYEVVLSTTTGQIGIQGEHIGLITTLDVGVLRYKENKTAKWKPIIALGGVAKIKDNEVLVLAGGVEEISKESKDQDQKSFSEAIQNMANADTVKKTLIASQKLKRASARVQGQEFLD